MKKPATITIGIPAYNEEGNIRELLHLLLLQRVKSGVITKIIVFSDGSTDHTVFEANQVKDERIVVINRKQRIGQNKVQNQLCAFADTDILVLLNADVQPLTDTCIEALLEPLLTHSSITLVSGNPIASPPRTVVEGIIAYSHELKKSIYEKINNGNTLYLCHGRIRALSKKLYQTIVWPDNCPEDAYSYLFCVSAGMQFAYARSAKVLFRVPSTLSEHILQSSRFFAGNKALIHIFSPRYLVQQLHIPKKLLLKQVIKAVIVHPLQTVLYVSIAVYVKLFIAGRTIYASKWTTPRSTKRISIANQL